MISIILNSVDERSMFSIKQYLQWLRGHSLILIPINYGSSVATPTCRVFTTVSSVISYSTRRCRHVTELWLITAFVTAVRFYQCIVVSSLTSLHCTVTSGERWEPFLRLMVKRRDAMDEGRKFWETARSKLINKIVIKRKLIGLKHALSYTLISC